LLEGIDPIKGSAISAVKQNMVEIGNILGYLHRFVKPWNEEKGRVRQILNLMVLSMIFALTHPTT
jgi:hypothetical protein